jgi:hypothetical protein
VKIEGGIEYEAISGEGVTVVIEAYAVVVTVAGEGGPWSRPFIVLCPSQSLTVVV